MYSTRTSISLDSHSPWYIHLPVLMIPFGSREDEHVNLLGKLFGFILDDEYNGYRSNDDENINHEVKRKIQECIAEHLIHNSAYDFSDYKGLLLDGCRRAPDFIYSLKLSYAVMVEKRGEYELFWRLWSVLSPAVQSLITDSTEKGYRGRRSDGVTLIRGMLHADTHWQNTEYEVNEMANGKDLILGFVKNTGSNQHVFEALASLMYQFPTLFFDEGLHILADFIRKDDTGELIKGVNTSFYLERSIQNFLQVENAGALKKAVHSSCLVLLDAVVETASARAYYLREHLIRSRRILDS